MLKFSVQLLQTSVTQFPHVLYITSPCMSWSSSPLLISSRSYFEVGSVTWALLSTLSSVVSSNTLSVTVTRSSQLQFQCRTLRISHINTNLVNLTSDLRSDVYLYKCEYVKSILTFIYTSLDFHTIPFDCSFSCSVSIF